MAAARRSPSAPACQPPGQHRRPTHCTVKMLTSAHIWFCFPNRTKHDWDAAQLECPLLPDRPQQELGAAEIESGIVCTDPLPRLVLCWSSERVGRWRACATNRDQPCSHRRDSAAQQGSLTVSAASSWRKWWRLKGVVKSDLEPIREEAAATVGNISSVHVRPGMFRLRREVDALIQVDAPARPRDSS